MGWAGTQLWGILVRPIVTIPSYRRITSSADDIDFPETAIKYPVFNCLLVSDPVAYANPPSSHLIN